EQPRRRPELADNLQRAIAAAEERRPDASHDAALIEGVKATQRMLEALLTRFGVQKIEALGKTFDPTKHEAMFEVEDPTQAPGTIVQVMEDGYTIHDRLLRPARVIVARLPRNA